MSWRPKVKGRQPYHLDVPTVVKFVSLKFLEPSGHVQGLLYLAKISKLTCFEKSNKAYILLHVY
jgi:hypothetical protein